MCGRALQHWLQQKQSWGALLALADRAAEGRLLLAEMAALIWHCLVERDVPREAVGEALVSQGVGVLRAILRQVLSGSA